MDAISIFDLVLVTVLVVVLPVSGAVDWRRFLRERDSDHGVSRLALYRSTMVQAWLLAFVVMAVFLFSGRSPAALGLQWPGGPWLPWALLAVVGLAGVLLWGLRSARHASAQQRDQVREALGPMSDFMPRDGKERRAWSALSVTAGITEELVFRAYLLWLLPLFVPTGWAVVLASLLFGFQHAYQGLAGVVRTGLLGGVLCGIYLASGSLLLPILAHVLIDLLQGITMSSYLTSGPAGDSGRLDKDVSAETFSTEHSEVSPGK